MYNQKGCDAIYEGHVIIIVLFNQFPSQFLRSDCCATQFFSLIKVQVKFFIAKFALIAFYQLNSPRYTIRWRPIDFPSSKVASCWRLIAAIVAHSLEF